jgi:hypothetical protein
MISGTCGEIPSEIQGISKIVKIVGSGTGTREPNATKFPLDSSG